MAKEFQGNYPIDGPCFPLKVTGPQVASRNPLVVPGGYAKVRITGKNLPAQPVGLEVEGAAGWAPVDAEWIVKAGGLEAEINFLTSAFRWNPAGTPVDTVQVMPSVPPPRPHNMCCG